jgi:hypothetical protein
MVAIMSTIEFRGIEKGVACMRKVRIHRKFCSQNLKGDVVDRRGM